MKLNAKDLRIGNYVYRMYWNPNPVTGKTKEWQMCKVVSLGLEKILTTESTKHNKYVKSDYDIIKPIPLTEELLIRLEYQGEEIDYSSVIKVNDYESYRRYYFYNVLDGTSNLEIHVINSSYGGVEHKEFVLSIDNDDRQGNEELVYLHQLQNGVHWLTNKELTLKD